MFVFEAHTITRSEFPLVVTNIVDPILRLVARHPPYLPYQTIFVARKIALSVFIAVAQIAPQFRRSAAPKTSAENQLYQVDHMITNVSRDAHRLLELEVVPFMGDPDMEKRLREQLKGWLVQNEVRNDPGVSAAIRRALERKRLGEEESE
jgi:hypothetical protein